MDQTPVKLAPAKLVRTLHTAMATGLVLAAIVMGVVMRGRVEPALPATVGVALAGLGTTLLIVAMGVMRKRVPRRASGESEDAFWGKQDTQTAALVFWAVIEGAGLMSLVGYMLTGRVVAATVAAFAIVMLLALGPARLERAD